ncbi:MAG: DUF2490 domain-containing protein [Bacteroidetes bacterium]|nr:DUF2490 domain-containing protein [Bacteroidota bacterium]MBS1940986.1 DUF2490 domain-containing protein [Bacteroidota bacterium]
MRASLYIPGGQAITWLRKRIAVLPYGLCLLMVISCSNVLLAQESGALHPVTRSELWLSATGSYKPFNKKTKKGEKEPLIGNLELLGELAWRIRMDPLASRYWYTAAGTKLKLNDLLKVGAEYRYNWKDRYTSNVSRMDLQLWLGHEFGRVGVDHRVDYQHEFIPVDKLRSVLRNRLTVEYNIPNWKLDPHFSAEAFTGFHYTGNDLVGMRYELGTELAFDKKKTRTLDLAVRYDQELHTADPENRWIFVIGYGHEFKKK